MIYLTGMEREAGIDSALRERSLLSENSATVLAAAVLLKTLDWVKE